MHPRIAAIALICAIPIGAAVVSAQNRPAPAFDVASVKVSKTTGISLVNLYPNGRFSATNFALGGLITRAWGLQGTQLDGGPAWMRSDGFDIEAKAEGNPPADQVWLMLRQLLTERFKLAVRTETRELPVYELVMARSDRRLGPKLRPSTGGDCSSAASTGGPLQVPDLNRPSCGALYTPTGHWVGRGITMDALARSTVREANRVVLNRTGLEGKFDLELEWTDLVMLLRQGAGNGPLPPTDGPSFFGALQEQLGLKLEAKNGPVDVLIVEHAEKSEPD